MSAENISIGCPPILYAIIASELTGKGVNQRIVTNGNYGIFSIDRYAVERYYNWINDEIHPGTVYTMVEIKPIP